MDPNSNTHLYLFSAVKHECIKNLANCHQVLIKECKRADESDLIMGENVMGKGEYSD